MRRCWNCGKKSQGMYCDEACRSAYFLWLKPDMLRAYHPDDVLYRQEFQSENVEEPT